MKNSKLEFQRRCPIFLDTAHHISMLIVFDAHWRVLHGGVNETMNFVRSKFWIPKLRQLTRKVINKCVICKWVDGKSYSKEPFPPLPSYRVSVGVPFDTSGVDFAGPLYVKAPGVDKEGMKAYIFLITCM